MIRENERRAWLFTWATGIKDRAEAGELPAWQIASEAFAELIARREV